MFNHKNIDEYQWKCCEAGKRVSIDLIQHLRIVRVDFSTYLWIYRVSNRNSPRLSRNKARDVYSPASRNRRLGQRRGVAGTAAGKQCSAGRSRRLWDEGCTAWRSNWGPLDCIYTAARPPVSPGVSTVCNFVSTFPPAEVVSGPYSGRERLNATFYLPSFTLVLRHLSSSPRYNFSPSSSRLASRTFRLHSM